MTTTNYRPERTPEQEAVVDSYRAARDAYYAAVEREDAAFRRYFDKIQSGNPTNGAAVSRLSNRSNELSAALYSAQGPVYDLDLDPWDIDDEDGVPRSPVGFS